MASRSKIEDIRKKKNTKKISSVNGEVIRKADSLDEGENNFKIVALIGFLVSVVLVIFSYNYFGSYFETNDDPRYVMAMKGFASPLPYDNFISIYKLTIDLYISLYNYFPNVPWYGYSMFLLACGSLFNIFITLFLFLRGRVHLLLIYIVFMAFYFLIYLQNLYFVNFTRPSILGTSTFIFLLTSLYLNIDLFKKNKWILIFPAFIYIYSHLTRLDGGHLGFLFSIVPSLILISFYKNVLNFVKYYILPVLIFIVIVKVFDSISQKSNPRNKELIEKSGVIRQLVDYRNTASYIPENLKDTIAFNAVNAKYANDNKVISIDYLKKLTNDSPLLERRSMVKFNEEFDVFKESIRNENVVAKNLNFSFLIILLIWLFTSIRKNIFGFLKYVVIQLYFLSFILSMCYYMKLPPRIYNPLLVLLTISNIYLIITILYTGNRKYYYLLVISLISILFAVPNYTEANSKLIGFYKKLGKINHGIFNELNKFSNTIFIPTNVRSWEIHSATDPIREINFRNNNCYVYLSIELSITPETQDQLVKKFGTFDHSELFTKISKMSNVVFISNQNYNRFLITYYHFLYNQDYYFEEVLSYEPVIFKDAKLKYYRLKKY